MENETENIEKTKKESKKKQKTIDNTIKYSWKRVFKRGCQNMKEDIDPIYKGTKIGLYALHGIPTWRREYKDGKLSNTGHWFAGISALFTLGVTGAAYALGFGEAVQEFGTAGYGVLGIPVASQIASYTKEAFRKSKKTELSDVIMSRVYQKIDAPNEQEYDLSLNQMIEYCGQHIEQYEKINHRGRETSKEELSDTSKKFVASIAGKTVRGLFADDKIGKSYVIDDELKVGPEMRDPDNNHHHNYGFAYSEDLKRSGIVNLIEKTVDENNGSANIELFGQMTRVYDLDGKTIKHYQVKPSEIWKDF